MMEENVKDAFQGQIGRNIPRSRGEVEENILRILYDWWIQGRELDKDELCRVLGISRRKLSYYIRSMTQHGYIYDAARSRVVELTDFGKEQGHECRDRHRNITQFIQLICGVDEETAEENACRMEHVVGNEVIEGIFHFLQKGETYDNEIHDMNFNTRYKEGIYRFRMTLYESDRRYPRILAEEYARFREEIEVEVDRKESEIRLLPADGRGDFFLWYQREKEWKKCEKTERGFAIPSAAFVMRMSPKLPVTEGIAMVGITDEDRKPCAHECRELNIHLW